MTSNSENSSKRILQEFLQGSLTFAQLKKELKGLMEIDFSIITGRREIRNNTIDGKYEISVEPLHLQAALERYLHNQIDEVELSDWAAFIIMAGIYRPLGSTEEEQEREAEGVLWDILRRIMVPQVFSISKNSVRQYLESIKRM